MLDLTTRAGLPLALDGERLILGDDVLVEEFKTRARGELEPVAREPEGCAPPEQVQYWMWNGVARSADAARWSASPVRYELTLLSFQPVGGEKSKTLGHIHNASRPDPSALSFAEAFEVLHGTAHFLFYTFDAVGVRARFCGWSEAGAGGQLVCPPNLYHLTINAGHEPLLFADLIARRAVARYDQVKRTRGAPYYELATGDWVRNERFQDAAPLVSFAPPRLNERQPLYTASFDHASAFEWLDQPEVFYRQFPDAKPA